MKQKSKSTKTLWHKSWFRSLNTDNKCLVLYFIDNCNEAGILEDPSDEMIQLIVGSDTKIESLVSTVGDRFEYLFDGSIYFNEYLDICYGGISYVPENHRKMIIRYANIYGLDIKDVDLIKPKREKIKFDPPCIADVYEKMSEKLSRQDATRESEKFIYYYSSNDWKIGSKKMINWKGAAAGWVNRFLSNTPRQTITELVDRSKTDDIKNKLTELGDKKISEL